ncbi:Na+/H+ antiporter [Microbulbifer sp. OS29]|uniref:Na+/H+ antiporter n=1 Tax=Microbulbifer okhotskensis TaxID=2926617 RepID=A0A9X2EU06_9GAMM|nr:Na+/H+ antiporter [Microbulbifer okhotskensis]MCO1335843.1 Na+/H+ antiporter [Microbulbifer okhotskensis]
MHYLVIALVLLLVVAITLVVARLLPLPIPLPLIQIVAGVLLGSLFGLRIPLEPEVFFLLFVPPLLFVTGWRIPKGAMFRDIGVIATLAVGLVVFTVVGVGFFISWLVPVMPVAVAFAVAAILAPTDPVAVSVVHGSTSMPPRLEHILAGESLFNDASGLDIFRFAVIAALTGVFSLPHALVGFFWVALGGIVIGAGVAFICGYILRWLVRIGGEDPSVQVLVSLLVPFAAYIAANGLQVSGILAAASAGIATHYTSLHGSEMSTTRMDRRAVWKTVQTILDGIIFVLLGEQLIRITEIDFSGARHTGDWMIIWYVLAIFFVLFLLRFVWVWVSLYLSRFGQKVDSFGVHFILVSVLTIAGVRGAITLAGAFSLPLFMSNGTPLPGRDLALIFAMGVILLSLLLASFVLPVLLRHLPEAPNFAAIGDEKGARLSAAKAAVSQLVYMRHKIDRYEKDRDLDFEAVDHLLAIYKRRMSLDDDENEDIIWMRSRVERHYHLAALTAEREQLLDLRIHRKIDDELHRKLVLEVDLVEASLIAKE